MQVRVCIIDTGVDWQHPDLAGNLWMNQKEVHGPGATAANGYQNGIDDDNDGEDLACMHTMHSACRRPFITAAYCAWTRQPCAFLHEVPSR